MRKARSRILQGAREALAYAKGEADESQYGIHIPKGIDVREIRKRQALTQQAFAERYGLSVGLVRKWERRSPVDSPSRILLTVIDKEPEAVVRALAKTGLSSASSTRLKRASLN